MYSLIFDEFLLKYVCTYSYHIWVDSTKLESIEMLQKSKGRKQIFWSSSRRMKSCQESFFFDLYKYSGSYSIKNRKKPPSVVILKL